MDAPETTPMAASRRCRIGRDRGFSLVEITASMAIIAVLALAVLPQFSKYFERAAVQNLSSEVEHAAGLIESDYSLTGQAYYLSDNVQASLDSSRKSPQTTWGGYLYKDVGAPANPGRYYMPSGAFNVSGNQGVGYMLQGYNPGVNDYWVLYCSIGTAPGLKVEPSNAAPYC